jgi:hypothetical protein
MWRRLWLNQANDTTSMKKITTLISVLFILLSGCKAPYAKRDALEYLCKLQKVINLATTQTNPDLNRLKYLSDTTEGIDKLDSFIEINKRVIQKLDLAIDSLKHIKSFGDRAKIKETYTQSFYQLKGIMNSDMDSVFRKAYRYETISNDWMRIIDNIESIKGNCRKAEKSFDAEYDIGKYDLKTIDDCAIDE